MQNLTLSIITTVFTFILMSSCGKNDDSTKQSDYGLQKVKNQEVRLQNDFQYDFSDKDNALDRLTCNEAFMDNSLTYMLLAKDFTQKVIKKNKHQNDNALRVVEKYNLLREHFGIILENWSDNCTKVTHIVPKNIIYKSQLKAQIKDSVQTSPLLKSLESIEDYKTRLDRVIGAVEKGQTPNLIDIEKLHLYQQVLYSKESAVTKSDTDNFESKLEKIIDKLPSNIDQKDFGDFKVSYEKIIESNLGKKIEYNKAYFSVPSKVNKGKTQCLGGTKTDLILNLKMRGSANYYNKRPVVILTSGHILPGHLIGHQDEWHLYGTETTSSGKSQVYYGNIKNIENLEETTLVVDAFDYLYINSIQHYLEDPKLVTKNIFLNLAKKYKIKNAENIYSKTKMESAKNLSSDMSQDVFSFGKSTQTAGTFSRSNISTINKSLRTSFISPKEVLTNMMARKNKAGASSIYDKYKLLIQNFKRLSLPSKNTGGSSLPSISGVLPIDSLLNGFYQCKSTHNEQEVRLNIDYKEVSIYSEGSSMQYYRNGLFEFVEVTQGQYSQSRLTFASTGQSTKAGSQQGYIDDFMMIIQIPEHQQEYFKARCRAHR